MNKKIKSGVFTFDENVVSISKDEIKEINLKNNDNSQKIKQNNNIIKDKKNKFNIDKLLKEDPFFFF